MRDDDSDPAWDLDRVRPVTRSLIRAFFFDIQPTPAAATDFGIRTQAHYEALYYPARNDEISFAALDAAYGNGPKLTELANAAPSNPHTGIVFETPWDHILPRGGPPGQDAKRSLAELQAEAARKGRDATQHQAQNQNQNTKGKTR